MELGKRSDRIPPIWNEQWDRPSIWEEEKPLQYFENRVLLRSGQQYTVETFIADHYPAGYRKELVRQSKIDLINGMLDKTHHGYLWLIRFDESWDHTPWRARFVERGYSIRVRCFVKQMSDYDEIILPEDRPRPILITKKLIDFSTAEILEELKMRVIEWAKKQKNIMQRRFRFR